MLACLQPSKMLAATRTDYCLQHRLVSHNSKEKQQENLNKTKKQNKTKQTNENTHTKKHPNKKNKKN